MHISYLHRLLASLILLLGVTSAQAAGVVYEIPQDQRSPQSLQAIQSALRQQVQAELSASQCGAWNTNEEIGTVFDASTHRGGIAQVTGAPGRVGDPQGNKASGLAKRTEKGGAKDDGYLFPDNAIGFVSACDLTKAGEPLKRWVWHDGGTGQGGSYQEEEKPPFLPALYNDVCRWFDDGPHYERPQTPQLCQEFTDNLNKKTYKDCRYFDNVWVDKDGQNEQVLAPGQVPAPPPPKDDGTPGEDPGYHMVGKRCAKNADGSKKEEDKYLCSEQWVNPPVPTDVKKFKNAEICNGAECRCPGPGCIENPASAGKEDPPAPPREKKTYISYFRKYVVHTDRGIIPGYEQDKLSTTDSVVACYGLYDEYDPKTRVVDAKQMRTCVIKLLKSPGGAGSIVDVGGEKFDTTQLVTSQATPGQPSPSPVIPDAPFVQRNPAYSMLRDLWYPNLGAAFSLLSEHVFQQELGGDLSQAFLLTDTAKQTPVAQSGPGEPYPAVNNRNATDDTVSNDRRAARTVVTWWQQYQTDMQKILLPPLAHLRLPSDWVPAFKQQMDLQDEVAVEFGLDMQDPRTKTVEVQIRAGDDLLGTLSTILEGFLRIDRKPVPVVVPLGSSAGYRGLAQQWKDYELQRESLYGPDSYPDQVKTLISQLEAYADRIDQYRAMRADLADTLSQTLTRQKEVLLGINDWEQKNLQAYLTYMANYRQRLELQPLMEEVQGAYARYHDAANQPWCRTDDLTTPLYAQLDPWLPGRPGLTGGTPSCDGAAGGLPILCVSTPKDLVMDLTHFRMSPQGITLPVLAPVPILLVPPSPPRAEEVPDLETLKLPDLPPVPSISALAVQNLPTVDQRGSPAILPPAPQLNADALKASLTKAKTLIQGMTAAYLDFWDGIGEVKKDEIKGLECATYGTIPCYYAEPELLQDFTRIVALPMVYLKESLNDINAKPFPGICDPADRSCNPLRPERTTPADGWQIVSPANVDGTTPDATQLRTLMREMTIDPQGKYVKDPALDVPLPYRAPATDLYPVFNAPPDTKLLP
jgi:hypothetical protein